MYLLPNKMEKKNKEDYTTFVAQHTFATDVVWSSLSFFFCHVWVLFIPILFLYFGSSLHDFSFERKFLPLVYNNHM